jgi:hypothetical protein
MVGAAALVAAGAARAEATCSGNACGVLALGADGCSWANKGDKAVRFSLIAGTRPRVVTVLAPGETVSERDKAFCVTDASSDKRYEASFAVLAAVAPDDGKPPVPKIAIPRAKPAVTAAAPAVAPAPAAAPVDAVAAAAPAVAVVLPRAKPAMPQAGPAVPRAKPEFVSVAAPAVAAPVAAVAPAAAVVEPSAPAEDAADAPPVLFKVIDNCLWVLNPNPRAVAFEAEAQGRRTALALEAADGAKADEHAAALSAGSVPKDAGALHMRLKDPFQSAGSGIPVFRARLGAAGACVKTRAEITRFSAAYTR